MYARLVTYEKPALSLILKCITDTILTRNNLWLSCVDPETKQITVYHKCMRFICVCSGWLVGLGEKLTSWRIISKQRNNCFESERLSQRNAETLNGMITNTYSIRLFTHMLHYLIGTSANLRFKTKFALCRIWVTTRIPLLPFASWLIR